MNTTSTSILGAGAVIAAGLAATAIVDQLSLGWTRADVSAHYGPFGEHPDLGILTTVLAGAFTCATVVLAIAAAVSAKGWNLAALVLVALVAVAGIGFAALTTFAAEFDGHVFTTFWRFVPWAVPVVAMVGASAVLAARK